MTRDRLIELAKTMEHKRAIADAHACVNTPSDLGKRVDAMAAYQIAIAEAQSATLAYQEAMDEYVAQPLQNTAG